MHFNLTTITSINCRLQSKLSLVITISSIIISVNNARYMKYIQLLTTNLLPQNQSQIGVCGLGWRKIILSCRVVSTGRRSNYDRMFFLTFPMTFIGLEPRPADCKPSAITTHILNFVLKYFKVSQQFTSNC